nr:tautomerase family protein [Pseudomonas sp. MWU12-2020]
MPLVRVEIKKHADPTFAKRIGEQIYAAMRSAINVPEYDNFQVLNEHDGEHFIFDPQYLGIQRTDQLVIIQITLNEGRTLEQKKAPVPGHRPEPEHPSGHSSGGRVHQSG